MRGTALPTLCEMTSGEASIGFSPCHIHVVGYQPDRVNPHVAPRGMLEPAVSSECGVGEPCLCPMRFEDSRHYKSGEQSADFVENNDLVRREDCKVPRSQKDRDLYADNPV